MTVKKGLILSLLVTALLLIFSLPLLHAQAPQPQKPFPGMPPADVESITVKIIPGVHAVIEAPSSRVSIQHTKTNTIIFIDTRPQSELGKP